MRKLILPLLLVCLATAAFASIDYSTDRMNFPPGDSRVHNIYLTNNEATAVTVNISVPTDFTNIGTTCSYPSTNFYNCQMNAGDSRYVRFSSPGSCTEQTLYYANLTGNVSAKLTFVCIPDSKIVDFKIEYGHGDANYLSDNELYISNETATLFNLMRIWNIGHYLDPDEEAHNATITCYYENYPVRTYGRVELNHTASQKIGAFWWDSIFSGYWFRIGVVSQDVSKQPGEFYNVSCTDLRYQFNHHQVIAPFSNYSIEARTTEPFIISVENITGEPGKVYYVISNIEKYTAYEIYFDRQLDGYQQTQFIPELEPGKQVKYKADRTGSYNLTVFFVPSWQKNSWNPVVYRQEYYYTGGNAPVVTALPDIAFIEDSSDSSLDLDNYVYDSDNLDSELNWTVSGNSSIYVDINPATHVVTFTAASGFNGYEDLTFTVTDPTGFNASDTLRVTVFGINTPPQITSTIPDQNRPPNTGPWTLDLTAYESDAEDSGTNLIWEVLGVDTLIFNVSLNLTTDEVTFIPLKNISAVDRITFVLKDTDNYTAAQDIFVRINMSIPLYQGWNLISVPPLKNESVFKALAQLGNGNWGCGRVTNTTDCNASNGDFSGNWTSIQTYNKTDGSWLVFNPSDYYLAMPSGQEFYYLETDVGYWINMTANASLILDYDEVTG